MKKLILCAALVIPSAFALSASADVYPQYMVLWIDGKQVIRFLDKAAYGGPVQETVLPICPDMNGDRPMIGRDYPLAVPEIVKDETGYCVEFVPVQI